MRYTNETHPVPLDERKPLPCGCHTERRADGTNPGGGDRWCYITFTKTSCRFCGPKIGRNRPGFLRVPFNATEADIERARQGVAVEESA